MTTTWKWNQKVRKSCFKAHPVGLFHRNFKNWILINAFKLIYLLCLNSVFNSHQIIRNLKQISRMMKTSRWILILKNHYKKMLWMDFLGGRQMFPKKLFSHNRLLTLTFQCIMYFSMYNIYLDHHHLLTPCWCKQVDLNCIKLTYTSTSCALLRPGLVGSLKCLLYLLSVFTCNWYKST